MADTATRYRVIGPCVQAKTTDRGGLPGRGYTVALLYRGSLLPTDTPIDQVKHLLAEGLIEEVTDV